MMFTSMALSSQRLHFGDSASALEPVIWTGRVGEAVSARGDGGAGGAAGVHSVPGPSGRLSLGSGAADPRFESPGRCCSASDCKYQTLPV